MVIIGREITVSALREWMAEIGARATVAVSGLGKVKTTAQMISIALLILRDTVFGPWVYDVGSGAALCRGHPDALVDGVLSACRLAESVRPVGCRRAQLSPTLRGCGRDRSGR